MTPTYDQRYTRRLAREAKQDVSYHISPSGRRTPKIGRKKLCVRVSREAAERLRWEAEQRGMTQQDLLSRMLLKGLPRYSHQVSGDITPHLWNEELLKPDDLKVRVKRGGEVQLNLWISSTAANKLTCHKTATKRSKARIVQQLILTYQFLTPEQAQKHRDYLERTQAAFREWEARRDELAREMAGLG
jgi:hypothetical protein